MRRVYACGKCDGKDVICVAFLEGRVQLLPGHRDEASKSDSAYWGTGYVIERCVAVL